MHDLSHQLHRSPLKGSLILIDTQGPGASLRSWFWDMGRIWSWLGPGHLMGLPRHGFVFPLSPFPTPRGHIALLQVGLVFAPWGKGLSTITTWSKRCASSWSTGNSSGTRYPPQSMWSSAVPHQETSHKSSAIKPIGPRPPLQRSDGKMPPPRGGQPRQLRSG